MSNMSTEISEEYPMVFHLDYIPSIPKETFKKLQSTTTPLQFQDLLCPTDYIVALIKHLPSDSQSHFYKNREKLEGDLELLSQFQTERNDQSIQKTTKKALEKFKEEWALVKLGWDSLNDNDVPVNQLGFDPTLCKEHILIACSRVDDLLTTPKESEPRPKKETKPKKYTPKDIVAEISDMYKRDLERR